MPLSFAAAGSVVTGPCPQGVAERPRAEGSGSGFIPLASPNK
jgi:hypothetical protein